MLDQQLYVVNIYKTEYVRHTPTQFFTWILIF